MSWIDIFLSKMLPIIIILPIFIIIRSIDIGLQFPTSLELRQL